MKHNLIDEYRIWIFPVILGCGQRLFRGGSKKLNLRLVETKQLSSGGIILTYRPE
jgi:dihydrofolate reductase